MFCLWILLYIRDVGLRGNKVTASLQYNVLWVLNVCMVRPELEIEN